ncbi:hypothetical protein Tco_1127126 [Tanacetum coccineum]
MFAQHARRNIRHLSSERGLYLRDKDLTCVVFLLFQVAFNSCLDVVSGQVYRSRDRPELFLHAEDIELTRGTRSLQKKEDYG